MASPDNVFTEKPRRSGQRSRERPTQRLMAAINCLEEDDATLEDVAERYGFTAGWLSCWLARFERLAGGLFEDVVYGKRRPDRPSTPLKKSTTVR